MRQFSNKTFYQQFSTHFLSILVQENRSQIANRCLLAQEGLRCGLNEGDQKIGDNTYTCQHSVLQTGGVLKYS